MALPTILVGWSTKSVSHRTCLSSTNRNAMMARSAVQTSTTIERAILMSARRALDQTSANNIGRLLRSGETDDQTEFAFCANRSGTFLVHYLQFRSPRASLEDPL